MVSNVDSLLISSGFEFDEKSNTWFQRGKPDFHKTEAIEKGKKQNAIAAECPIEYKSILYQKVQEQYQTAGGSPEDFKKAVKKLIADHKATELKATEAIKRRNSLGVTGEYFENSVLSKLSKEDLTKLISHKRKKKTCIHDFNISSEIIHQVKLQQDEFIESNKDLIVAKLQLNENRVKNDKNTNLNKINNITEEIPSNSEESIDSVIETEESEEISTKKVKTNSYIEKSKSVDKSLIPKDSKHNSKKINKKIEKQSNYDDSESSNSDSEDLDDISDSEIEDVKEKKKKSKKMKTNKESKNDSKEIRSISKKDKDTKKRRDESSKEITDLKKQISSPDTSSSSESTYEKKLRKKEKKRIKELSTTAQSELTKKTSKSLSELDVISSDSDIKDTPRKRSRDKESTKSKKKTHKY